MAASLLGFALSGTTTSASAPTMRAACATAAPWLPVEAVTMPCPSSSAESESVLLSAPRALKEPVCCRFSHLSTTGEPTSAVSPTEGTDGVVSRCVRARSSAARTSAATSMSAWGFDTASV